jgi:hypothetical protein
MAVIDWGKGLVKGLVWGGLIGVVVGILYTKKKDLGTWEEIGKSADELIDKTKEQLGQAQRKIKEFANREPDSMAEEKEGIEKAEVPQE